MKSITLLKAKQAEMKNKNCNYIYKEINTPFYIFNKQNFISNYGALKKAFSSRYNKLIIAYSYKTNYIPYICKLVMKMGGYAEVVSRMEYDLAIKVGQNPKKIIFNGPVKTYNDISNALKKKSMINLDSRYSIECLKKFAAKRPKDMIEVGLRVNIDLNSEVGRFGFPRDHIIDIVNELKSQKNINVVSLHGHTITVKRSVSAYRKITETLCNIAEESHLTNLKYINVGGGIYGDVPEGLKKTYIPTFDEYAEAICGIMNNNKWIKKHKPFLVLEPGISITASALSYITKVHDIKEIECKLFAIVDGSIKHIKPNMSKLNLPFEVIHNRGKGKRKKYNIVGSTCMEKDYLLRDIMTDEITRDDIIKINHVGAYTIVFASPFINPLPPVILEERGKIRYIRKRQSFRDVFRSYDFN